MNNERHEEKIFEIILITIAILVIGIIAGIFFGKNIMRKQAIAAEVAEYVVNPKTGETKFVYKTPKQ